MAEAFARIHGGNEVEVYSAGSKPSGKINPRAIASMKEAGYDLTTHQSKSLEAVPQGGYDVVVTMGCGDACPWIEAKRHVDWNIPDPKNMSDDQMREVRDLINEKVSELVINLNERG